MQIEHFYHDILFALLFITSSLFASTDLHQEDSSQSTQPDQGVLEPVLPSVEPVIPTVQLDQATDESVDKLDQAKAESELVESSVGQGETESEPDKSPIGLLDTDPNLVQSPVEQVQGTPEQVESAAELDKEEPEPVEIPVNDTAQGIVLSCTFHAQH